MVAHVLTVVVVGLGLGVPVAVAGSPPRVRAFVAGLGTACLGLVGVALGAQVVCADMSPVRVGWLLPLSGAEVGGDALSGALVLVTGAVSAAVGVFLIGYARDGHLAVTAQVTIPLFVATMLLVPLAASIPTFLMLWELMALSSAVLVLTDHHNAETRRAGVIYLVMTHLGFLALLLGLSVLGAAAHADGFAEIAGRGPHLSAGIRTAVFALTAVGFGSKAGLLPLHAWLPHAHPAAPGPVSALMSAAMVNLGIYGLIRVDMVMIGPGPDWWGLILLIVGAATAVYAVLQASVATDLKRLLAYSTSENMGLVTLGIGAAMMLTSIRSSLAAALVLTGAVLQLINHAAFKTVAFLSASAVQQATGLRDLDRLGGLSRQMPATTAMFGVASLAGSGLPLGAAFVSEWLMLQGLIHAVPARTTMVGLAMPLAVASVALAAGLGVVMLVKAFGVGFLARARSDEALGATEARPTMLAAMALGASVCTALAVVPGITGPLFGHLESAVPELGHGTRWGVVLRLPGPAGSVSPLWIAALVVTGCIVVTACLVVTARRRPMGRAAPLWASGAGPLTPRMQYTATAFAEPLQRVFHDVLRPETDVDVSPIAESRYLLENVTYRNQIDDAIETRLYAPVVRAVTVLAQAVRRAHNGSVHLYLAYGAAGLLVALVVAR